MDFSPESHFDTNDIMWLENIRTQFYCGFFKILDSVVIIQRVKISEKQLNYPAIIYTANLLKTKSKYS